MLSQIPRYMVFHMLAACIFLLAGCSASPPAGQEPVEMPAKQSRPPREEKLPSQTDPSPEKDMATFDQTTIDVLAGILENIPENTPKTPIIRVAKEDFHSTDQLDNTWIAKHLRLQLNALANGQAFFVDSVADLHAKEWSRSHAFMRGQWNLAPSGYRLNLELIDRKKEQVLWKDEMIFR